jgi:hypothetical protein
MGTFFSILGALLLVSCMVIGSTTEPIVGPALEETADVMEVLDLDEASVAAASTTVDTNKFWWGLPETWWPTKFCLWDSWTTAAWQVTLAGAAIKCNDATGRVLANMARQGVMTNPSLRRMLGGSFGSVTVSSVLCARSSNTVNYIIRFQSSRNLIATVRQPAATTIMNRIFSPLTVSRRLGGKC